MTRWSPDMDDRLIIEASFIQGLGLGMVFAPMNVLAFGTVKPELRPDGSSLMALFRNLGGSFGISGIVTMLARNQQTSHVDLASKLTSDVLATIDLPGMIDRAPDNGAGMLEILNAEVGRQAAMIAYLDNFYVIFWILLVIAPLPFLLKKPQRVDYVAERFPVD
jgi:DHA2 family multidrug resistance protein